MSRNKRFLVSLLVGSAFALSGAGLLVTAQGEAAPVATTLSPAAVGDTMAVIRGSVVPNGQPTGMWFEYGPTEGLGSVTGAVTSGPEFQPVAYSFTLGGLKQNQTYYYRAMAQNGKGISVGQTLRFMTGFPVPSPSGTPTPIVGQKPLIMTSAPMGLTDTAVTLQGVVNPQGEMTSAWFEYGLEANRLTGRVGMQAFAANAGNTTYTHQIVQLLPNTTYYYRAAAENKFGMNTGTVTSFRTLAVAPSPTPVRGAPEVMTQTATNATLSSAILRATVKPNGASTMGWFEYGTTLSLGGSTPPQFLGNSTSVVDFSTIVNELKPGTTYIYRAVAQNATGRTNGMLFTVTTSGTPAVPSRTPVPATPRPRPLVTSAPRVPAAPSVSAPAMPANLSPNGTAFDGGTTAVTLIWGAAQGNVMYAVRVQDQTDNAARDPRNNCANNPHYVCINDTKSTSISVPVTAGHRYTWWVHTVSADGKTWSKPATATFSVAEKQATSATVSPADATPTPTIIVGAPTITETATSTERDNIKFFSWIALAAIGGFLLSWIIFGTQRREIE